MKVKIGKYSSWFGPYQLAEALCFWAKPVLDEHGLPDKPKWVHQFGEILAHGSVQPEHKIGEAFQFGEDCPETWLYKLLKWINSKKERKISVHIDKWDTWSMDNTLAYIVLPMLKQLKDTKHGAPYVDDEDVLEYLRSTVARELTQEEKNIGHVDDNHFKRWDWALDEMIFAFQNEVDGDWEDQFTTGEYDFQFVKTDENGTSEMVKGPNHTAVTDWEGRKAHANRIQNGFKLFGKYYQHLWD